MKYDIYCDESNPDLLTTRPLTSAYMAIGGICINSDHRDALKLHIHELRDKYRIGPEFKWAKVSRSRFDFYEALLMWFCEADIKFKVIVVDVSKVDLATYHNNDSELGFYRFYFHLLRYWLQEGYDYSIFLDFKTNRNPQRLPVLQKKLSELPFFPDVRIVQGVRSEQSVLVQLADVLTGLVASKFNQGIESDSPKSRLIASLEGCLGKPIAPTLRTETKFNIFEIRLEGAS